MQADSFNTQLYQRALLILTTHRFRKMEDYVRDWNGVV